MLSLLHPLNPHWLNVFRHVFFFFLVTGLCLSANAAENQLNLSNINEIRVDGFTVFSREQINAITSGYQGRELYIEDIIAVRDQITQLYVDAGYITSGAFIPPQSESTLRNGVFSLGIIEGDVPNVSFEDTGILSENFLAAWVDRELKSPLNENDLQALVSQLEMDARVDSIQAQLRPTDTRGEADLVLSISEADVFFMSVTTNNYLSPSVDSEQIGFSLAHLNLTGRADELFLSLNRSDGVEGATIAYNYPLVRSGITLQSYYSIGDAIVVEEPFDTIDIKSSTDTAGFAINKKITISVDKTLSFTGGIEKKTSETSLLGQPFDFSTGSINGKSKASVTFAGIEFRQQDRNRALIVKSTLRHGVDLWGATRKHGAPDSQFDSLILQAQFVSRIRQDTTISIQLNSQLTNDSLQAFERFAIGGHDSVRGFRENQLLKDNGWEALIEAEWLTGVLSESTGISLAVVPSLGYGRGWNSERIPNVDRAGHLSSVGIGFRLFADSGWNLRFDWAHRLNRKTRESNELQDRGIHLGFSYGF